MGKWLAAAMVLLLGGCGAAVPQAGPVEAIAHWEGRPVAEAVAAWGPPTEIRTEEEGTAYVWLASQYDSRYFPANLNPLPEFLPYAATIEELRCRGVLIADPAGLVRMASWQGYECYFLP